MRHHWTKRDVELLRRHYGKNAPEPWGRKRLAAVIGVKVSALSKAAWFHDLAIPRIDSKERDGKILEAHARGLDNPAIAREIGVHVATVCRTLRRHGRGSNYSRKGKAWSEETKKRANRKRYCYWRVRGYRSTSQYVRERRRIACEFRRRGCQSEVECRVMDLLDHCSLTALEIESRLGLKRNSGHIYRIVRILFRRGLIEKRGHAASNGRWAVVWGVREMETDCA